MFALKPAKILRMRYSTKDKIDLPTHEIEFSFARSSGKGGQNVNKVNSKAVLRWNLRKAQTLPEDVKSRFVNRFAHRITAEGDLLVQSQRFRDQEKNAKDCLDKLRRMLEIAWTPPKERVETKATHKSRQNRLKSKRKKSEKKQRRRLTFSMDD